MTPNQTIFMLARVNQWDGEKPRGDAPHRIDSTFQSCRAQMEGCWEINKGGMVVAVMVEEETEQEDKPAEETEIHAKAFPDC